MLPKTFWSILVHISWFQGPRLQTTCCCFFFVTPGTQNRDSPLCLVASDFLGHLGSWFHRTKIYAKRIFCVCRFLAACGSLACGSQTNILVCKLLYSSPGAGPLSHMMFRRMVLFSLMRLGVLSSNPTSLDDRLDPLFRLEGLSISLLNPVCSNVLTLQMKETTSTLQFDYLK